MTERDVWEIRVGVYATEKDAEAVKERIQLMLCPDPDHASPCPVPWFTTLLSSDSLEPGMYDLLLEQARAEGTASE